MKTVNQVTKISGVSRRTLQYYDEIGLLKPDGVKPSGYRLYSEENLARLWRILFYKEIGFQLLEINKILDNPPEMERQLMQKHRDIIVDKRQRLDRLLSSVDQILNDHFEEALLMDFDMRSIEEVKRENQKSADRRLIEGDPFYDFLRPLIEYKLTSRTGVLSMIRNIGKTSNLDWDALRLSGEEIGAKFAAAMEHGPDSLQAAQAASMLIGYINDQLFLADKTVLSEISKLYLKEAKFVDAGCPGLARFVTESLKKYLEE